MPETSYMISVLVFGLAIELGLAGCWLIGSGVWCLIKRSSSAADGR